MIAAGVGKLGDEPFGAEFCEVIAQRSKGVAVGRASECLDDLGVDVGGGEGIAGGDVGDVIVAVVGILFAFGCFVTRL